MPAPCRATQPRVSHHRERETEMPKLDCSERKHLKFIDSHWPAGDVLLLSGIKLLLHSGLSLLHGPHCAPRPSLPDCSEPRTPTPCERTSETAVRPREIRKLALSVQQAQARPQAQSTPAKGFRAGGESNRDVATITVQRTEREINLWTTLIYHHRLSHQVASSNRVRVWSGAFLLSVQQQKSQHTCPESM